MLYNVLKCYFINLWPKFVIIRINHKSLKFKTFWLRILIFSQRIFLVDNNHSKEGNMFELASKYKPSGDQPQAIKKLVEGIKNGEKHQVLKGVTGSGKTFTMANVIAQVNKPKLILDNFMGN